MKAVGFTSGIGSMLVGARNAGFKIMGNIEWRRYYHHRDGEGRNTFEENFKAPFWKKAEDLTDSEAQSIMGLDLAMGHPECGNYSQMSATAQFTRTLNEMRNDAGDTPIFVDLVKKFKPRFFVQDNLPKSLMGYPIETWIKELPEYDIFPEWISNWGYGNIQKFRKRLFIIGALKTEKFVFVPAEIDHDGALRDLICDLDDTFDNHHEHTLVGGTSKGRGLYSNEHMNWGQCRDHILNHMKEGETLKYLAADGTWKQHVGWRKGFKDGYVHVITGGCPIANPFTGLPFSLRERCRIMGLPDDFILYGENLNEEGLWNHYRNMPLIKQTGKCMPVQFCEYVSRQIAAHIKGKPWKPKGAGQRIINDNKLITEAKEKFCKISGYAEQQVVCEYCWKKECELSK